MREKTKVTMPYDDADDQGYEAGSRMAWTLILQHACKSLGYETEAWTRAAWIVECELALQGFQPVNPSPFRVGR
jgi:hypothetical protein